MEDTIESENIFNCQGTDLPNLQTQHVKEMHSSRLVDYSDSDETETETETIQKDQNVSIILEVLGIRKKPYTMGRIKQNLKITYVEGEDSDDDWKPEQTNCVFLTPPPKSYYDDEILLEDSEAEIQDNTVFLTSPPTNLSHSKVESAYKCDKCTFKTKYKYSLAWHLKKSEILVALLTKTSIQVSSEPALEQEGFKCDLCIFVSKKKYNRDRHMI